MVCSKSVPNNWASPTTIKFPLLSIMQSLPQQNMVSSSVCNRWPENIMKDLLPSTPMFLKVYFGETITSTKKRENSLEVRLLRLNKGKGLSYNSSLSRFIKFLLIQLVKIGPICKLSWQIILKLHCILMNIASTLKL